MNLPRLRRARVIGEFVGVIDRATELDRGGDAYRNGVDVIDTALPYDHISVDPDGRPAFGCGHL